MLLLLVSRKDGEPANNNTLDLGILGAPFLSVFELIGANLTMTVVDRSTW